MSGRSIKALIFDFDGLILETELPEFQSWAEIYEEHGCHLSLATWASYIGTYPVLFDPYQHLEVQCGNPIDRDEIRARRRRRNAELLEAETIKPGVQQYLKDARSFCLWLGVASSSPRNWVETHLKRLCLFTEFDCIKCGDEVANAKPHPDVYKAVLDTLDIDPDAAIAFEDSPNGVLAAKRAGIFCVAVPNALTSKLPIANADLILSSLADMSLADVLSLVGNRRR